MTYEFVGSYLRTSWNILVAFLYLFCSMNISARQSKAGVLFSFNSIDFLKCIWALDSFYKAL